MFMDIWGFLGREYEAIQAVYDTFGVKLANEGDTFFLIGVDQDGIANIIFSKNPAAGINVFAYFDWIEGSRATGRIWIPEKNIIELNSRNNIVLPRLIFEFED